MPSNTSYDPANVADDVPLRDRLSWSPDEFARLSGFSRAFLYNEAAAGHLTLRKRGRRSFILREDGLRWLNAAEPKVAA